MTDRITKAEQRILDLIAECPELYFTHCFCRQGYKRDTVIIRDAARRAAWGPTFFESKTTVGVMNRLAARGIFPTGEESYGSPIVWDEMGNVRPVTSSEVA